MIAGSTEVTMTHKVRVNLANALELRQLQGVSPEQVEAIVRFRAEHGPIRDAAQLAAIIGASDASRLSPYLDFSPSDATAPEAPGA
jgi:DNA uptake protein ComE-like DNA-binding protein